MGVKEIPPRLLEANKAYMYFAHVIKAQEDNMEVRTRCCARWRSIPWAFFLFLLGGSIPLTSTADCLTKPAMRLFVCRRWTRCWSAILP